MPEDTNLSALPEAVPLRSVAPLWRVLAILALIASAFLLLLVGVLGVAALSDGNGRMMAATAVAPMPPPFASGPGGAAVMGMPATRDGTEPDVPDDPRTSPYFPLRADLAVKERQATPPRDTPARRFLQLGEDVWRVPNDQNLDYLAVAWDGRHMATVHAGRLLLGTVTDGLTMTITGDEAGTGEMAPPGVPTPPVAGGGPDAFGLPAGAGAQEPGRGAEPGQQLVTGVPSWGKDKTVVCFATAGGRMRIAGMESGQVGFDMEALPFAGEAVAHGPGAPRKFFVVRTQAVPKLDTLGRAAPPDHTEVVVRNLSTKIERTLIPASPATWKYLTLAPDGKRLALVSNRGDEKAPSEEWRVFVLDLAGGEPKAVTPPTSEISPLCWTPDNNGLVYARSQQPDPADHWEDDPASREANMDLFYLDLSSGKETRLTRGGGFFSPSVDRLGNLYYLTSRGGKPSSGLTLRRMALEAAQAFATKEGPSAARTADEWGKVAELALNDAGLAPDTDGVTVTPEMLVKVADAFARRYQEVFGHTSPINLDALDRQRRELECQAVPKKLHAQLRLTLGIVEGEFLRRNHGAHWLLEKGPLVGTPTEPNAPALRSPFFSMCDPFDISLSEKDWPSYYAHAKQGPNSRLADLLQGAEGRRLVLSNASNGSTDGAKGFIDPDLARGETLLREDKKEEGARVLLEMMQRDAHRENAHLAVHVGTLLYQHDCMNELVDLMKRQARKPTLAARKYNLLGLAQMTTNPQEAISSFRTALRHDLHDGAVYLNLAQAHEKTNNLNAAVLCLRRCLQLMPQGPYARDAQRRLGEVQAKLATPSPSRLGGGDADSP